MADTKGHRSAWWALGFGLAIAVAANLAYAIPRGAVTVGLGLVCPLILPWAIHLRTTFEVSGFWPRVARESAMLLVAIPAVIISASHTIALVTAAGEPWPVAWAAPLSSDGLAGLATLALHRQRAARKPASRGGYTAPPPRPKPSPPKPTLHAVPPGPLGDGRTLRQVGVDWAVAHWHEYPDDGPRPVEIGEALAAMGVACSKGERSKIRIEARTALTRQAVTA